MKAKLQTLTVVKFMCTASLLLICFNNGIAQHTVSGTVVDASTTEPIPGVSILVQGTERGTATNVDGNFELDVQSQNATLILTFVGYERQEIQVDGRSELSIELIPSILVGDDVVVIGYGIQERASLTGSVGVVDSERLQRRATPSISQALQGLASGVEVQSAGHPGADPNILIRGVATFGNNDPLYVIDGVPVDNISDFNMRDVESLQVLKDASAAAIYGSRAANGVIIITTKQGQAGALNVDYDMFVARHDVPGSRWWDMANREEYQYLNNLARENVGLPLQAGNDPNHPNFVSNIDTDWQEEAFRTGWMHDHNLTISGGTPASRYSVSGNFLEQEGTMRGSAPNYDRKSVRVNSSHDINRFRFGQALYYSQSFQDHQATDHLDSSIENVIKMAPTIPVFDENRVGGYGGASTDVQNAFLLNPIGANNLFESTSDRNRTLVNLWGEVDLLPNLYNRVNFSYDRGEFRNFWFEPIYDMGFAFNNNIAVMDETRGENVRTLIENTLHYQTNIGSHGIDLMAGYSEERNNFSQVTGHAEGFTEPYFKVLDAGPDNKTSAGFRSAYNLRSFFGRLNYNFDDRYLFSATIRHDGSSRFSPENRYGTFPSVSAGWRISNESFFDINFVDELKIRGSYGQVGNQDIGDFSYAAFINTHSHYVFGNQLALGATQLSLANPNVRWETNISSGIGLDVELFGEKFIFTADYYRNESHNVLIGVPIPSHVGAIGSPTVNAADIRNTGFEFAITYRDFAGDLRYNIGANVSTINNQVLALGAQGEPITGSGSRTEVGREIGEFFGYVTDGIFQNEQEVADHAFQTPGSSPGDIRFRDLNGDGLITADDRTYLGSAFPDFYFGVDADFNYRNWDLSIQFTGTYGNKIYNRARARSERAHEFDNYPSYFMTDVWRLDNTEGHLPRMAFGDPNQNARMSDRWIEDGSHAKLRNLQLGFTIPADMSSMIGISNLRFYVSGQNLFTITNYSGYDPEVGRGGGNNPNNPTMNRGTDAGSWPNPRILMVGLQLRI